MFNNNEILNLRFTCGFTTEKKSNALTATMAFNQGFNQQNFKRGRDQGGSFGGDRGPKRFRADNDEPSSTIFLGNLAPDVSESQIAEAFGPCGQIKEIRLKRHEDTGKVKGIVNSPPSADFPKVLAFWNLLQRKLLNVLFLFKM